MISVRFLKRIGVFLRQLTRYIGPGFMVAVGYLDPGNWATDMEGGSGYGYRLLFIILFSNLVAVFLQNLTIRLGTVTGLDLASCSRRYFPRYLNLFLYVLAELAIIATDMAEVIGSAIALNILFPALPLPAGVAITVVDVFIILLFYNDDPSETHTGSMRVIRYFEIFVMLLVTVVGVCMTVILAYSDIRAVDVLKGYLPSKGIFTDSSCLYVAIGIIGATVMPHNLYLHSFVVQSRCRKWRAKRPVVIEEEAGQWVVERASRQIITTSEKLPEDTAFSEVEDREARKLDESSLRNYLKTELGFNLRYGFIDLVVALLFAFYINSAILTVAGANFYYSPNPTRVTDLYSASELLTKYIGSGMGTVFALALLFAGQSSTITATLAGQVVMDGFLRLRIKPWIRRFVTRLIAIIPALVAACAAGRSGLNDMLVASQVALSIQLPFAVVPLVYFTSRKSIMKLDLIVDSDQLKTNQQQATSKMISIPWIDRFIPKIDLHWPEFTFWNKNKKEKEGSISTSTWSSTLSTQTTSPIALDAWPSPIQYENKIYIVVLALLVSLLVIGLNGYVVVSLFLDIH